MDVRHINKINFNKAGVTSDSTEDASKERSDGEIKTPNSHSRCGLGRFNVSIILIGIKKWHRHPLYLIFKGQVTG